MFRKIAIISFAVFLLSGSLETIPILNNFDITALSIVVPALFVFTHIFTYIRYSKLWLTFIFLLFALILLLLTNLSINSYDEVKLIRLISISVVCITPPFYLFRNKMDIYYFLNTLMIISYLIALVSLLNYNSLTLSGRLTINESNPIWLARAVSIGLVWSVILYSHKKLNLIKFIILFSPMLLSLLLTGSKAPILALIASMLILIIIKVKDFRLTKKRFLLIFFGVITIVPFSIFLWNLLPRPTQERLSLINFEDSARESLYNTSIELTTNNFWGIGLGNFGEYSIFSYPHNFILESFVEIGWLFTMVFLVVLVLSFTLLLKYNNKSIVNKALLALFIVAFINSMFSGDLTSPKELYIISTISFFLPRFNEE